MDHLGHRPAVLPGRRLADRPQAAPPGRRGAGLRPGPAAVPPASRVARGPVPDRPGQGSTRSSGSAGRTPAGTTRSTGPATTRPAACSPWSRSTSSPTRSTRRSSPTPATPPPCSNIERDAGSPTGSGSTPPARRGVPPPRPLRARRPPSATGLSPSASLSQLGAVERQRRRTGIGVQGKVVVRLR